MGSSKSKKAHKKGDGGANHDSIEDTKDIGFDELFLRLKEKQENLHKSGVVQEPLKEKGIGSEDLSQVEPNENEENIQNEEDKTKIIYSYDEMKNLFDSIHEDYMDVMKSRLPKRPFWRLPSKTSSPKVEPVNKSVKQRKPFQSLPINRYEGSDEINKRYSLGDFNFKSNQFEHLIDETNFQKQSLLYSTDLSPMNIKKELNLNKDENLDLEKWQNKIKEIETLPNNNQSMFQNVPLRASTGSMSLSPIDMDTNLKNNETLNQNQTFYNFEQNNSKFTNFFTSPFEPSQRDTNATVSPDLQHKIKSTSPLTTFTDMENRQFTNERTIYNQSFHNQLGQNLNAQEKTEYATGHFMQGIKNPQKTPIRNNSHLASNKESFSIQQAPETISNENVYPRQPNVWDNNYMTMSPMNYNWVPPNPNMWYPNMNSNEYPNYIPQAIPRVTYPPNNDRHNYSPMNYQRNPYPTPVYYQDPYPTDMYASCNPSYKIESEAKAYYPSKNYQGSTNYSNTHHKKNMLSNSRNCFMAQSNRYYNRIEDGNEFPTQANMK
ncbi:hypothetical protein Kpol_1054p53 [Vanderwaltozyma polyspora DSM 70294]|uniref:Uncharacterized protein n=1 Tax=Vanderwaltozyma polyspora (strain ATCC 22028 / DSM 70294 / BCRC 21397 / CBS 2163 / NBRC 10782 / NRRL Y-8283 / UCD 57-17) TaxID=436907 RepID=A7TID9_VANPO|nr:uncharacterized protein Kpol_1054p53 [Vanderwaltozyma polyspora DSM 70294]EDO18005.1 hypothetical protein Kpol_1054p53 [Vanderwaltozyma polyspora DSM 70294]